MGEIFAVALAGNNVQSLRFHHSGGEIHSSVLSVRDGRGGSWNFNCRSERGGYFTISGSEWRGFAEPRINEMVTLFRDGNDESTLLGLDTEPIQVIWSQFVPVDVFSK